MQAADLAHVLRAKRSGRQWSCRCPAHDDAEPSLIFWQGHSAIRFKCYAGCEPEDVIAALRRRGLWENSDSKRVSEPEREPDHRELALGIWRQGRNLAGSPGEVYLQRRGLRADAVSSAVARFHPDCPRGKDRSPALVVLMRAIVDGVPCAVQRIFIGRDYTKEAAMMLGPAGAAAMKLAPAGRTLTVCEGFETALALHQLGHGPVWALGSAGAIARFPIVPKVEELVIATDHDNVGKNAAATALERWGPERAHCIMINAAGADFADLAEQIAKQR
jgi:hypothetical protein